MTMDLLGLMREDLIDGLEEPIGAATALAGDARRGRLALHLARRAARRAGGRSPRADVEADVVDRAVEEALRGAAQDVVPLLLRDRPRTDPRQIVRR